MFFTFIRPLILRIVKKKILVLWIVKRKIVIRELLTGPPLAPPQWMQHQTDQRKYILLLIDGIYLHLISSEVAGGNYWCLHCLLQPSFLHFVQAPRYNYWLYSYSHSRLSGSPLSLYYNYCKSPTLLSETEKKKNRLNFHGNNRWMRESAASK